MSLVEATGERDKTSEPISCHFIPKKTPTFLAIKPLVIVQNVGRHFRAHTAYVRVTRYRYR